MGMGVSRPPAGVEIPYCRSCGKLWSGDDPCCKKPDRVPLTYVRSLDDRALDGLLGGNWKARAA